MNVPLIEVNEANFDREVLNATQPALVHFWADWSAPCKAMAPILESVAEDAPGFVKVARVNVEQHEKSLLKMANVGPAAGGLDTGSAGHQQRTKKKK